MNCSLVSVNIALFKKIVRSVGGFWLWTFIAPPGAAIITMHLSFDTKVIFSPIKQSSSKIIVDLALLRFKFFFLNNLEIFLSLIIVLFEKTAFAFSFKLKIDKSDLPFESKTTISQVCFPSSLMISILSSGKTSITERPPPLTKYFSTPGGKVLKPGFFISLLVCSIANINFNN